LELLCRCPPKWSAIKEWCPGHLISRSLSTSLWTRNQTCRLHKTRVQSLRDSYKIK
jgi:hypothetical protein